MSGVIALIVAVTGLLGAAAALIALFRKQQQIHVLVNSQLHQVLSRVTQLTDTLNKAGIDVPAAPGHGEAGGPPEP